MFWEQALYFLAWLSFGCWSMAAMLRLADYRLAKIAWRIFFAGGSLLLWFHILVAYGWRHQWSWQQAVTHTRQILDERQLYGVSAQWSVGLNWIFAIGWSMLVAIPLIVKAKRCELNPESNSRPRRRISISEWVVWGFAGFFWFQAAVVFAKSEIRELAGIVLICLLTAAFVRILRGTRGPNWEN